MVEFCTHCKSSLPRADLTVQGGEIFASHDYDCPFCHKPANPSPNPVPEPPLPDGEQDVEVKGGAAQRVKPA